MSRWRPSPGEPLVEDVAQFLVAENWSEQGLLLDAFVSANRPKTPTIVLEHRSLPIGPAGASETERWGIRLSALTAHETTALRSAFEAAAEVWRAAHQNALPDHRDPQRKKARARPSAPVGVAPHLHSATLLAPGGPPAAALNPDERTILAALLDRGILTKKQLGSLFPGKPSDEQEEHGERQIAALAQKLNGTDSKRILERVAASASGPVWRLHRDRIPAWVRVG